MFITGPKVVKAVTNVSVEDLGGACMLQPGVTHFTASTEEEALNEVRRPISFTRKITWKSSCD